MADPDPDPGSNEYGSTTLNPSRLLGYLFISILRIPVTINTGTGIGGSHPFPFVQTGQINKLFVIDVC
jgi:hypothetical protein